MVNLSVRSGEYGCDERDTHLNHELLPQTAFVDRAGHYISAHFLSIYHFIIFLYMFYIYHIKNTSI